MKIASQFFAYGRIHFKSCSVKVREQFARVGTLEKISQILALVTLQKEIEFVLISTCNRFDICFFGKIKTTHIEEVFFNLLKEARNTVLEDQYELSDFLSVELDEQALRRLFKVTASLDSLLLGESQILGQVKDSFHKALRMGYAREKASSIFNFNFRVAKRVRSETQLGRHGISIGSAAVEITTCVFENLKDKKILILGAGEMARLTIQHLNAISCNHSIIIANRTFWKAERLSSLFENMQALDIEIALNQLEEFDVCFVAMGGDNPVISPTHFKNYAKKRHGRLSVFVDMSVPRKIDPIIADIENLFLFNIDDLDTIADKNKKKRKKAASLAEIIIEEELANYIKICKQRKNLKNLGYFHQWIRSVVFTEVQRCLKDVKNGKENNEFIVADAVAKKVVANAAIKARNGEEFQCNDKTVGQLLEFLFPASLQISKKQEKKSERRQNNVIDFSQHQKGVMK